LPDVPLPQNSPAILRRMKETPDCMHLLPSLGFRGDEQRALSPLLRDKQQIAGPLFGYPVWTRDCKPVNFWPQEYADKISTKLSLT
jgi:hypothetical protein